MSTEEPQAPGRGLPRRDFIRLGATGLAASVAAGTAAASPETASADERVRPGQNGGPAADGHGSLSAPIQEPLSAREVVDPRAIPIETWQEPWVWRPDRWPGDALELHVVRNQNPGPSASPGMEVPTLYSYAGAMPGPTIRARGEDPVRVRVRNHMGLDRQMTPVGPCPDPIDILPHDKIKVCRLVNGMDADGSEGVEDPDCRGNVGFVNPEELYQVLPVKLIPGWANLSHANGQRTAHVTNIHTHGLHVPPNHNPDGSLSDNVLMRIVPLDDWEARLASGDPHLAELQPHERIGSADYKFLLGEASHGAPPGSPSRPHPPGTHWYHPHAHGSTHDQVASGMVGFFIVEGDVDTALNRRMTGEEDPDPAERTGPFDYRERLMLVHRVLVNSLDLDAGPRRDDLRFPPVVAVNGRAKPSVIFMRPGAVERWRTLNGSVDGSGFKRFMVLEGQFVHERGRLWKVLEGEAPDRERGPGSGSGDEPASGAGDGTGGGRGRGEPTRRLVPVSDAEVEGAKLPIHMLAFDGITLVVEEGGQVRHAIRDLSLRNAGTPNPMTTPPRDGEDEAHALLRNIESAFRDGDSLRRAFVRPNEVYMGAANRADLLFKAPTDAEGRVFTVLAREDHLASDKRQELMQSTIQRDDPPITRPVLDVVVAYIHVRGEPVEGGDLDIASLNEVLPPVPPFLLPVREEELRVPADEARARGVPAGSLRTRVVSYSGTGGADWPLVHVPEEFARNHPELEHLVWDRMDGTPVLLPNLTRTMGINPDFDLAADPEPRPPRKFSMIDPDRVRTLVNTAEEWVLYNCSLPLWSQTNVEKLPQPGHWGLHWYGFPLPRAEGQRRFWEDPDFRITSKAVDHPFHIHINPMWVIRVDVPDENGTLHNVLPEPRWMDTVPIPRSGGRVVFRTRFLDFTGTWVNHCHILLHEDNGMMAIVECVDRPGEANYRPRDRVAEFGMDAAAVNAIYPPPSREVMYRQNLGFVDPSPETGQIYPGFDLEVPAIPSEDP